MAFSVDTCSSSVSFNIKAQVMLTSATGSSAEFDGCWHHLFPQCHFFTDLEAISLLSGVLHDAGFPMGRILEVVAPSAP